MTIREAIEAHVRYVRLPEWVPRAQIELPLLAAGQVGPWAIVRDPRGETPVLLYRLLEDHDEDRYEAC